VLVQHGLGAVLEHDVVLRVAAAEFGGDLGVEVVAVVLGFPVAEWHAQFVQQGAVYVAAVAGLGVEFVLGHEHEVVLAAPALEQVLERLAHHRFAAAAADFLEPVEVGEVLVDEDLAHGGWSLCQRRRRTPAARQLLTVNAARGRPVRV